MIEFLKFVAFVSFGMLIFFVVAIVVTVEQDIINERIRKRRDEILYGKKGE